MFRLAYIVSCLAAAVAAPAYAQQAHAAPNESIVVTGQQYDKRVVCRFEQQTGTRFQTRTCHTTKEWDQMREQQLRNARELIDKAAINNGRG